MNKPPVKNNILIVDDNSDNLSVLRKLLVDQGYLVRPALSGDIALKAVKAQRPDIILLDILMPEMDGYEVCTILKSDNITADIPIIFISALSEVKGIVKAFQAGGVDYITKPFRTEEVLARVKTHLELQNAIREKEASTVLLQTILSSIEDTIVTVDNELHVINSNKPPERICSDLAGDGKTFPDRIKEETGPCFTTLHKVLKEKTAVSEYRVE